MGIDTRSATCGLCPSRANLARLALVTGLGVLGSIAASPDAQLHAQVDTPAAEWQVSEGRVQVRCPLTVGGSFDASTARLSGRLSTVPSSRTVSGTLAVDVTTLDTGIGLRDQHMRDRYLEVSRGEAFSVATLRDIELDQPLSEDGSRHRSGFSARLEVHGVTQTVRGEVDVQRRGSSRTIRARFPLSLEAFAIPPPRYLGVGVRDRIEVTVDIDLDR